MAITAIIGGTGAGKTSFLVYKLKTYVLNERRARFNKCITKINEFNTTRKKPLSKPDRAPFYTNFDVSIPIGYKKTYSPYWLNPYYFGMPNQGNETQPIMPYGVAFLTEMDRVYDSHKKDLPAMASELSNKNRHFWLDIYIDVHRIMNINTLVRDNLNHIIEILKQEHEKDELGRIVKTTWFCREFDSAAKYLQYVESSKKTYTETTYEHIGNIFKYYDSFECAKEFLPGETENFSLLELPSKINVKKLPKDIAKLYNPAEPPNYRKKLEED